MFLKVSILVLSLLMPVALSEETAKKETVKLPVLDGNLEFAQNIELMSPKKVSVEKYARLRKEQRAWKDAVVQGIQILPEHVARSVANDGLFVGFWVDETDWVTATPMMFNLAPSQTNLPEWFTWEPFLKNGLTKEERLFVVIHELGHIYDVNDGMPSVRNNLFEREFPTRYGKIRGSGENFADCFALYVMWPDYLKEFPEIYSFTKESIFGKEYASSYPMPDSVSGRLSEAR